jgi:hypothetical protein
VVADAHKAEALEVAPLDEWRAQRGPG